MTHTIDLQWACVNIPLFRKFKEQVDEVKRSEDAYRAQFAGCTFVKPQAERFKDCPRPGLAQQGAA